jgi:hypothetical protein
MSKETHDEYCRMLADLPFAETDMAVEELEATWGRLPTIFRIRDAVISPTLNLPTAEEAWDVVQRRGDRHELIGHVVNLFGGDWNIRTSADPELTRTRFIKAYEEQRRKAVNKALAAGARDRRLKQAS